MGLRRRESTQFGSEAPFCPRCRASRRCGLRRRSMMSLDQPLCTGNALEFEYWREILFLFILIFKGERQTVLFCSFCSVDWIVMVSMVELLLFCLESVHCTYSAFSINLNRILRLPWSTL